MILRIDLELGVYRKSRSNNLARFVVSKTRLIHRDLRYIGSLISPLNIIFSLQKTHGYHAVIYLHYFLPHLLKILFNSKDISNINANHLLYTLRGLIFAWINFRDCRP